MDLHNLQMIYATKEQKSHVIKIWWKPFIPVFFSYCYKIELDLVDFFDLYFHKWLFYVEHKRQDFG